MRFAIGLGVLALVATGHGEPRFVGAGACASRTCHGADVPRDDRRDADGRPTVRHDEYTVWSRHDPHRRAYQALCTPAGLAIARRLGMVGAHADASRWPKEARDAERCLDCHALVPPGVRGTPAEDAWLADGVSCESCHGAAGGWLARHTATTRADSVRAGMVETMIPARAAEAACLRCHVGTRERRVDHDLLAAGHPVLAFELDYYARNMPAHWNVHAGNAGWGAPFLTGHVSALRASDGLRGHGGPWPDFALYDCAACHHEYRRYGREPARDGDGVVTGHPPPDRARERVLAVVLDGAPLAIAEDDPPTGVPAAALRRVVANADRLAAAGHATALQTYFAVDALVHHGRTDGASPARERALDRLAADVRRREAYDAHRFARDLTALAPFVP